MKNEWGGFITLPLKQNKQGHVCASLPHQQIYDMIDNSNFS